MNGIRIFLMFMSIIITLLVSIVVIDVVINSATGKTYTDVDWYRAEQQYCASQNLLAVEYIGEECFLFGCRDVQKTKCVGEDVERIVEYDNEFFCKYTVKGDLGWC